MVADINRLNEVIYPPKEEHGGFFDGWLIIRRMVFVMPNLFRHPKGILKQVQDDTKLYE